MSQKLISKMLSGKVVYSDKASKCIGLNSPTTFNEWIQKLLTLTISISATQE